MVRGVRKTPRRRLGGGRERASEDPGHEGVLGQDQPPALHWPAIKLGHEGKGWSLCALPRPRELPRVGPRQAHGHSPRGQVRPGAHASPNPPTALWHGRHRGARGRLAGRADRAEGGGRRVAGPVGG